MVMGSERDTVLFKISARAFKIDRYLLLECIYRVEFFLLPEIFVKFYGEYLSVNAFGKITDVSLTVLLVRVASVGDSGTDPYV